MLRRPGVDQRGAIWNHSAYEAKHLNSRSVSHCIGFDAVRARSVHDPTPNDEVSTLASRKRESFGLPRADIQCEPTFLPHLVLPMIDVERAIADRPEQNVVVPDDELTLAKAQRKAPVATSS
jgi:hypothetical protein